MIRVLSLGSLAKWRLAYRRPRGAASQYCYESNTRVGMARSAELRRKPKNYMQINGVFCSGNLVCRAINLPKQRRANNRREHGLNQSVPLALGATAAGAGGCGSARMRSGTRGNEKLPAKSSITLTWQRYKPGFKACSGKSIWKTTALRSGTVSSLATSGFDS